MAIYREDIASIDLNCGTLHRSFKPVSIGSGDQNANRFGIKVFRDKEPVDLDGVTCQAVFRDPMGNNIALTNHGTVSGNRAYVTLPQACYNYEGNFCLAIKLIGGGVTGTMRIVDGVVDNTHTGGAVAPMGAVPTYQEVLAAYEDAIAAVEDVNELKSAMDTIPASVVDNNILLGFPDVNRSSNNVTITGNVRSGITISTNGTASSGTGLRMFGDSSTIKLKAGKTYLYYCKYTGNKDISGTTWQLTLRLSTSAGTDAYRTLFGEGVLFSVSEDKDVIPFVRVISGQSVNVVFYPVLVEYSPEIAEIIYNTANRKWINILPKEAFADTGTSSGVTATNNHDGSFTITGTNSSENEAGAVNISNNYGILLKKDHTYLISSNGNNPNIQTGESTYRLDIRKLSASGTVIAYEYEFGGLFVPDSTDLYKFMLRFAGGYAFNNLTIKPMVIDLSEYNGEVDNSTKIRVCAYNVGNFSNGESGTAQGNDEIYRGLINAFQKCDADIYLFSEWDAWWNYSEEIESETLFAKFKPNHSEWTWSKTEKYIAQMIYSDYPFRMERHNFFNDGHTRHYVDDIVIIKGKPVHFISTHLNANDLQSRYDDYDKLKTYLDENGYEYYVIAGDFNHGYGGSGTIIETARDEIDYVEENLIMDSVQGGFYGALANDGFMNTYSSGNDTNDVRPYDNIFVSKNIRIRNAFVVETAGSDHYPICADIEIL